VNKPTVTVRFSRWGIAVALWAILSACSDSHPTALEESAQSAQIIEQAIRLEIGKPDGPITDGDRLGLTELHLSSKELVDLTPLAELRDLQGLSLSGCTRVSDLTPLENLPHLVYLDLTGCTGVEEIPDSLQKKSRLIIIGP